MSVIHYSESSGPVGGLVDALIANEVNEPYEMALRNIQRTYDLAAEGAAKAQKNDGLSPLGKSQATKRVITQAFEGLEKAEEHVKRLEAKVAATRSKALEVPAGERTAEDLAMEREIRDRLIAEKVDPGMLGVRYFKAIDSGDTTFTRALEGAPQSLPLLDDDMRQKGQEAKLKLSPFAERIAAEEAERDVFRMTVNGTKTELNKLANKHRVNMSASDFAPATNWEVVGG
jgi:hypothetical protein